MSERDVDSGPGAGALDDVTISPDDPTEGLASDLRDLDVIVVHDPVRTMNGGIDVVANIARFLEAPIYTLRQLTEPEPLDGLEVRELCPGEPLYGRALSWAGAGRLRDFPRALAYQDWEPPRWADIVVTTGTRSEHVIQHPEQDRIQFFNTPARWLWDLSHGQYDDRYSAVQWLMLAFANEMRTLDVASSRRYDRIVANSDLVRERVRSYYGRDADVAYCPVDTYRYDPGTDEGYFLVLTRIVPKKRVKLVIETFEELDVPLKIAGTATPTTESYAAECRRLAGDDVEFLGWVEGEQKEALLANASGLVFAGEQEDFGMPPVEAMASGIPVVGVDEGFTSYQVVDGENGVLFDPTVESLRRAVKRCRDRSWNAERIQSYSRRYDTRAVRRRWMDILRDVRHSEE